MVTGVLRTRQPHVRRAYSLLRFATADASGRRPVRSDLVAAESYCRRRNLALDQSARVATTTGVFGESGAAIDAVLSEFHGQVVAGVVPRTSVLLVEDLGAAGPAAASGLADRLARIVELGVTVVTLPDGASYTRAGVRREPASLLYAVVSLIRAHAETDARSRRQRASWARRRQLAQTRHHVSATCPAWLTFDRESGTFRVNDARARVVARVYEDAMRGIGHAEIAAALNREGVPVFGRGARWHRSYVLKLLRSAAVIGTYVPHTVEHVGGRRVRTPAGAGVRDYFPRIIDPGVFTQVQTLVRASRAPLRGRHATRGEVANVFGGLAHCGRCGAPVTLVQKGAKGARVRYLVCSAARVRSGCRRYQAIPYARFEAALLVNRARLLAGVRAGEQRADLTRLITEADAAVYRLGDDLENAVSRAGRSSRAAGSTRVRALRTERDKLLVVAEALRAERETTTGSYVRERVAELQQALAHEPLDRARVNTLLRQVFSGVTVDYDGDDLAFLWRHGGQTEIDLGRDVRS